MYYNDYYQDYSPNLFVSAATPPPPLVAGTYTTTDGFTYFLQ